MNDYHMSHKFQTIQSVFLYQYLRYTTEGSCLEPNKIILIKYIPTKHHLEERQSIFTVTHITGKEGREGGGRYRLLVRATVASGS